jgi:hypothetical protein
MDTSPEPNAVKQLRRWNPVAIVAALPIIAFFLAVNIPGEVVVSPNILGNGKYGYGPHFECQSRIVHGWPLPYLSHDPIQSGTFNGPSVWQIGENRSFSVLSLLFDCVVAVVATCVAVRIFVSRWRATRLRFSLRTLLAVLVGASVTLGWLTSRWRLNQAQSKFLTVQPPRPEGFGQRIPNWQPFGPLWVRQLAGDKYLSWGDRLVGVRVDNSNALASVPGKSHIQVLWLEDLDYCSPPSLEEFDSVVAIEVYVISTDNDDTDEEERDYRPCLQALASCKKLAGLNLYETGVSNRDLEVVATMANLQNLELSANDRIDDEGLKYLASLKKLRRLALYRTGATTAGVVELHKELPDCEIFWDPEQIN